ncbi:MAG TPA: TetR/AcrR family transcriptional regulator [Steroidobacteraceae bacterium]|jgi:TetR/AcrR family transcriptional repressor of nem operon
MPRASRADTEKNRAAIEQASSRLFREQGLSVSLKDVMGAAGLTHGGFYGHFGSKDDLVAAACANAFESSVERWHQRSTGAKDRQGGRAALIEGYLTAHNRASAGTSCPISALATDVGREPEGAPVREIFRAGIERLLEILTDVQPHSDQDGARDRALTDLSTLVGAMVLARSTSGSLLSDAFMNAAKQSLLRADKVS